MTTIIIILALAAAIIWGLARMFRNVNADEIEKAKTERRKAWFEFRKARWSKWRKGKKNEPVS